VLLALFAMLLLVAPASLWAMVAVVAAIVAEKWSRAAISCRAVSASLAWEPRS